MIYRYFLELCSCHGGTCNAIKRFVKRRVKKQKWKKERREYSLSEADYKENEETQVEETEVEETETSTVNNKVDEVKQVQRFKEEREKETDSSDGEHDADDELDMIVVKVQQRRLDNIRKRRRCSEPPCDLKRYLSDKGFSKIIDHGFRQHIQIERENQRRCSEPQCKLTRYLSDKDFSKISDHGFRQHMRIEHTAY